MGNLLDQNDIWELTKLAQAEDPSGPDGYGVPFAHLEAISNDVLPPNPPLDGEIALMGLKWPGYNRRRFDTLSQQRADVGYIPNPEQEAIYLSGHAFLAAVGIILPTIRTLAAKNHAISPWDKIHSVIKVVDNRGLALDRLPYAFINQIKDEFPK